MGSMRFLLHLLIAITLALGPTIASAQSYNCCHSPDCDVAQCLDMGCAPAAAFIGLPPSAGTGFGSVPREYAPQPGVHLVDMYEELWTPPD
jgi:hypothetical protein